MRILPAFALLSAALAWPAESQAPGPLGSVERGQWELRSGDSPAGTLCLGDPFLLAQPQHGPQPCTHEVISSDAHSVTVNYVCPGVGRGRTVLRVETPRLVQIDSQGLHNGAPFALRAQARKVGACG